MSAGAVAPSQTCRIRERCPVGIQVEVVVFILVWVFGFADASIDTDFSGTTSVQAIIRDRKLYVANIGDSRIVMGRATPTGKFEAVSVSDDHKPDRPDEQARIEERGGRVFAIEYEDGIDGPPRVWLGNMDIPGLAMARSLGDVVAHSAGVISDPEIHEVDITPSDKVRILWAERGWLAGIGPGVGVLVRADHGAGVGRPVGIHFEPRGDRHDCVHRDARPAARGGLAGGGIKRPMDARGAGD